MGRARTKLGSALKLGSAPTIITLIILQSASPALAQAFAYGASVAAGNFTGTGDTHYRDSVVASAPWDSEDAYHSGSVSVFTLYQRSTNTFTDHYLLQGYLNASYFTGASDGGDETGDNFGYAFAVGDFDGDGRKDLAIGVPYESVGTANGAGCVHILFGAPAGSGPLSMPFRQATAYLTRADLYPDDVVSTTPTAGDNFGFALTAGDFNGDGLADLVIGAPNTWVNGLTNAGAAYIFYAQANATGQAVFPTNNEWTVIQGGPYSPAGSAAAGNLFGYSLASGNINGDFEATGSGTGPVGRPDIKDLAVGAPGQAVGSSSGAGAVTVYYGGIDNTLSELVVTDPSPATNAKFGMSLAAGDFNPICSNGNPWTCPGLYDDLAVGEPNIAVGASGQAGQVVVFYGSSSGLSTATPQTWTSSSFGGLTPAQANAQFGFSLATGNVINTDSDNGGCQGQQCNPAELVIGEPYRNGGYTGQGTVYVLQGRLAQNLIVPPAGGAIISGSGTNANAGWSVGVGSIASAPNQDVALIAQDILIGEPGINDVLLQMGGQSLNSTFRIHFPWEWADGP